MFETILLTPDVLRRRALWPHLLSPSVRPLPGDPQDRDLFRVLLRCLNVTPAEVDDLYGHLQGPLEAYEDRDEVEEDGVLPFSSALDLPLPGEFVWRVGFFGGDDPGVYHEMLDTAGTPIGLHAEYGGTLGWVDVHWQLPVLRWAEVEPLARAAAATCPDLRETDALLLFASTAHLTAQDDLNAAATALGGAFQQIGVDPASAAELAARLTVPRLGFNVNDLHDDTLAECRDAPLQWWNPDGQGWRCNARRGFRREGSHWQARGSLRRFDDLLAGAGVPMT